ncbi:hypothetical protein PbB2_01156 [Candidatus Phycosocius bacilliformis]|uniref:Uncharacterized protein n=1 Tax=Candidatus Phycosocius bacilliformis TaxID=1445552 RepID=A0A2P2E8U8_9PROT|nr:tetratricopeptide repeat protein [Candidatus Phycosocius bacilliformis]GBF57489.1 hypothetical protein PbB2_01156 [Candidatus Phycosocius bacilliformis]
MRLKAVLLASAAALICGMSSAQAAVLAAPPEVERSDGRDGTSPLTRDRAYAGLSLLDAIRQALINGDVEAVLKTYASLGLANDDPALADYYDAVRAFSSRNYAGVASALKQSDPGDLLTANLTTWALVGDGKLDEAIKTWDRYRTAGSSGAKSEYRGFYLPYRALLAELAGDKAAALGFYEQAQAIGELHFVKDLTRRYLVLLVEAGRRQDALAVHDDFFGEPASLDPAEARFRASLSAGKPPANPKIDAPAAASSLLTDYVDAMVLMRQLQNDPEIAAANKDQDDQPEEVPDGETLFADDALILWTALLLDPENSSARMSLASSLSDIHEEKAALAVLEAVKSGQYETKAQYQRASLYFALENPVAAMAVLDQIPAAERDWNWWAMQAMALSMRGDFANALISAQRCVESAKDKDEWTKAAAQLALMGALDQVGRKAEAKTIARNLIDTLKPNNLIRGDAGNFLASQPETRTEGLAAARASLQALGASSQTRVALGDTLSRFPETRAEGIQHLRDALAELPRSAMYMNALGYTLVRYDIDLEEGFQLLQKAYELRPYSGAITDSLGYAHYKLGQLDEAQQLIEKAVDMRKESPDPEIYDNLGNVYWHQGKPEAARRMWQKAASFGPAYEDADAVKAKLKDGLRTPPPARRDAPIVLEPGSV